LGKKARGGRKVKKGGIHQKSSGESRKELQVW